MNISSLVLVHLLGLFGVGLVFITVSAGIMKQMTTREPVLIFTLFDK